MEKNITTKALNRWLAMLILLITGATQGMAQNVTISPKNGSMICSLAEGESYSQGWELGSFGTWRHNQLSLTMTGSNSDQLTEDGQLAIHANHFTAGDNCTFNHTLGANEDPSNWISVAWGKGNTSNFPGYITISLPKGYRFTSYTFHLTRDIDGLKGSSSYSPNTNSNVTISETGKNVGDDNSSPFSRNINFATIRPYSANNATPVEFTRTGDDMGNILYFKTVSSGSGYFELNCRYIELRFTADADATIGLVPSSQVSSGRSLVEIPFQTGKVDLGTIGPNTYNNQTRISYMYNTVSDMSANMLLYEEESVEDPKTALDGTIGKMAYSKDGSITTNGNYFQFAPISTKTEQIYYLETPVSATMSNSKENPVQFRITGATINYSKTATRPFYIKYKDGDTTYYLGTNGQFSTNKTQWTLDSDGHIFSGTNNYLTGTNRYADVTSSKADATTFTVSNNTIVNASGNALKYYATGINRITRYGYFTNYSSVNWTDVYPAEVEYIETSGVSDFTIFIYDKEGNRDSRYPDGITVTGTDYVELEDLNNDAIKFGVKGGDVALLNFDLKLQALNPYIDQMTVVLNDNYKGKSIRQTRTFTADDFSVGGGTFCFYLPTDCVNDHLTITFEDLYSKYGDDTYNHTSKPGTSNSRYNFVKSQHHQNFTNDNIYSDRDEAASGTLESDRIEAKENIRTQVGTVGNIAFRFNNADELADHDGYLTEYPFTMAKYAAQTGKVVQDGVETTANGDFITAEFEPTKVQVELHDKTFYVFTTDETRYNIAPTTATQHRFYAFYAMKVEVICQDYEPVVKFVPIYEKTLTDKGGATPDESPYFGVKVTGPTGVESPLASDVATYKAISKAVEKGDDVSIPKTLKQILYVDLSALNGVYHSNGTGVDEDDEEDAGKDYSLASFDSLRVKLAPNALIFLPVNSTDRFDNFAYAKKGEVAGSFQSANNIILTDKSPFYTPYTIQVDAANYATYTRLRTAASEDLVKKATVVLPFTMKVENGKHKNDTEDGFEFNLRYLNKLATQSGTTDQYGTDGVDEGTGNFVLIEGTETKANYPYMVEVTSANGSDYSFIAAQKGSNIIATPETITGESVADPGLTNTGTYSGVKLSTTKSFYYFTKNKYVASSTAKERYNEIYVQPFRAYYVAPTAGSKLSMFEIVYDEIDEDEGLVTDITTAHARGPLTVVTGKGFMTLTAAEDATVTVFNLQGTMIANTMLKAGERHDISVPAGVYVVNRNKVIVK